MTDPAHASYSMLADVSRGEWSEELTRTVGVPREVLAAPHAYRFVLHDRDRIDSPGRDAAVAAMGVRVLRTPVLAPRANTYCARLPGSLRRECLDCLIPLGEDHLRRILRVWRPHSRLEPGFPEPPPGLPAFLITGHQLPRDVRVVGRPILGGLHHQYGLEKLAARGT